MKCPKCSKTIPDRSPYCAYCGAALQRAATSSARSVAERDRPQFAIGLAVLLFSAAVFLGVQIYDPLSDRRPTPTAAPASPTSQTATTRPSETPRTPTASATPTPSPKPTKPEKTPTPIPSGTVVTGTDRLNVRRGPGTQYQVVTKAHDGDRLQILGRDSSTEWLKVRLSSGTQGWVSSEWVKINVSLGSLPILPAPPTPAEPTIDPRFRADHRRIKSGECTTLRWDIDGIKEVYLDGQGVVGHGSRVVCPNKTQTYTLLVVQRDGKRVSFPLTIDVSGGAPSISFALVHHGCIPHSLRDVGQVKGQVFDRNGNIVVNAFVEITVNGQSGVVPPGRSNEQGWYEWNLRPGQVARFIRLTVSGRTVSFSPTNYEVTATSGCYQRVDFRQR